MNAKVRGPFSEIEFKITGTLRGLRDSVPHVYEMSAVTDAHGAWQEENNRAVPCYAQPITMSFCRVKDGTLQAKTEPGWLLAGTFMPSVDQRYIPPVGDMAVFIAQRLGLESVSIHYPTETWTYTLNEGNTSSKIA